jgi:endonuclease-3
MDNHDRPDKIVRLLAAEYPDAECELDYRSPWELLVATVLSAQCTDQRVNQVTPEFFSRWPNPQALAGAAEDELEAVIRSTGFFRNKARSLREVSRTLVTDFDGEVPPDLDELIRLPGVGRKTAKVVLGEAFGIAAGVTVDTHVRRVSQRLGMTHHRDAEKIAGDLEKAVPRDEWIRFSMRMILHGRRVCKARAPRCDECVLEPHCPRKGL